MSKHYCSIQINIDDEKTKLVIIDLIKKSIEDNMDVELLTENQSETPSEKLGVYIF